MEHERSVADVDWCEKRLKALRLSLNREMGVVRKDLARHRARVEELQSQIAELEKPKEGES
jgi:hypothetical protein